MREKKIWRFFLISNISDSKHLQNKTAIFVIRIGLLDVEKRKFEKINNLKYMGGGDKVEVVAKLI